MRKGSFAWIAAALLCLGVLSSCGGGSKAPSSSQMQPGFGMVVVSGSDAPVASIVAFQITVLDLSLTNGSTTTPVITSPEVVEFSSLNGLVTLLGAASVPTGTYDGVKVDLASPIISFVDITQSPPVLNTLSPTTNPPTSLTTSSLSVKFGNGPITISQSELVGLAFDFQLSRSLQVDNSNPPNFTGVVNPTIGIQAIPAGTQVINVDELRGGVVSVDSSNGSFVLQGPAAFQYTIQTGPSTTFAPSGTTLASLNTNTLVEVDGTLDRASMTINAGEVDVVSQDKFFLSGIITNSTPTPSGGATVQLVVHNAVPAAANIPVGQIFTINLGPTCTASPCATGTEKFFIRNQQMLTGNFAFDVSTLIPGQEIIVGGKLDTSSGSPVLTPAIVMDELEGFIGDSVPATVDTSKGTFGLVANDVAGVLFTLSLPSGQSTVTVQVLPGTTFKGLNGLSDIANANPPMRLQVEGWVLLNHSAGQPTIIARAITALPSAH